MSALVPANTVSLSLVASGRFSINGKTTVVAAVTLKGIGGLTGTPTQRATSSMTMPAATMQAADRPYAASSMTIPLLQIDSSPNAVGAPVIPYAMSDMFILTPIMSGYILVGQVGSAAMSILPASMLSADRPYTSASMTLQAAQMSAYTYWGNYADAVSGIAQIETAYAPTAEYAMLITSAFTADSTMTRGVLYDLSALAQATVETPLSALAVYSLLVNSTAVVGNVVVLGGVAYDCVAVNATSGGISLYDKYEFNSFAKIGENYYAAGAGGVYQLGGDTDNEAPIRAEITTLKYTLSSGQRKNVPYAYLGVRASGEVELRVYTEGESEQRYVLTQYGSDMRNERVTMARGAKSMYWQFAIASESPVDIDYVDVSVLELKRRI